MACTPPRELFCCRSRMDLINILLLPPDNFNFTAVDVLESCFSKISILHSRSQIPTAVRMERNDIQAMDRPVATLAGVLNLSA